MRREELVECVRCVCVWLGIGGECMRGLGYGLTNPVGTGIVLYVCLFLGFGGVGGVCGVGVKIESVRVGGVMSVWVVSLDFLCVDGKSRYLYIVINGYLRILCTPSDQSCCTLSIFVSIQIGSLYNKSNVCVCTPCAVVCLEWFNKYTFY